MYAPHTVTLFNAYKMTDGKQNYQSTIVNSVFKQSVKALTLGTEGAKKSGTAKIFIPFSAEVEDGRTYTPPAQFKELSEQERARHFTFNEKCDFFVVGSIKPAKNPVRFEDYRTAYEDAHKVLSVNACDYGSVELRHWEVSGE